MMTIDPTYGIGIDSMDARHATSMQLIDEFGLVGSEHLPDQAMSGPDSFVGRRKPGGVAPR